MSRQTGDTKWVHTLKYKATRQILQDNQMAKWDHWTGPGKGLRVGGGADRKPAR